MKTLYIDCSMGAAGDMLMAALLELHPQPQDFLRRLNALGLPGVAVAMARGENGGLAGSRLVVTVDGREEDDLCGDHHGHHDHPHHEHAHSHDHDHSSCGHDHPHHAHHTAAELYRLFDRLPLPEEVRRDAKAVYELLAQAESHAHGRPVDQIHFHEVGSLDAAADVIGVCWLIRELGPERIAASPVHVGSGTVRCAHGVLPVPAPAAAWLLRDIPIYGGEVAGELCTPTGAALLRHFVSDFGPMPPMTVSAWGYGLGSRTFPGRINCLRAALGETETAGGDTVAELRCNLDDMAGEDIAFACEELLAAGALDVWTEAAMMKKGRPGVIVSCLCRPEDRRRLTERMMDLTTTLGVRWTEWNRETAERTLETRETALGPVRYKARAGGAKPEYEDVARLARERGCSTLAIRRLLEQEERP